MTRYLAALLLTLLALLPACEGEALPTIYTDADGGGRRDFAGTLDFSRGDMFDIPPPPDFWIFPDFTFVPGPDGGVVLDLTVPGDATPPTPDFPPPPPDLTVVRDFTVPGPDLATPPPAIRFAPALYQGGSGAARTIAALDLNGDGVLDVATAAADLAVTLAIKGGGWMVPFDMPLASGTHAAAFADFDGDRKIDAAVTISTTNSVAMMMGGGDGSFTTGPSFIVGVGPVWLVTDDFNRDGKADLASVNGNDNTVSVLLGNGDGTFAAPAAYKVNNGPRAIATGDFNNDKFLDIASVNGNSSDVSVLLGNGNGTFGAATHYITGPSPVAIATADFNADGRTDIVTISNFPATAVVLLASQNGFNAGLSYMAGNSAGGITTGDWNGDKFPDFAVSSGSTLPASVIPFIGNGKNNFVAGAAVPVLGASSVGTLTTVDMNLDGKADILAATGEGAATLLTNDGAGNFAATLVPTTVGAGYGYTGDVNNDAKPDVVGFLSSGQTYYATSLLSLGTGRLTFGGRYQVPASGYFGLGDVNGDKNLDLVLMHQNNQGGSTLLGNGDGSFKAAMANGVNSLFTSLGALGDLDGDGRLDMVGGSNNQLQVFMGNGNGTFKAPVSYGAGTLYNPIFGDWSGDKVPDVLAASQFNPTGAVLFTNKGNGTLSSTNYTAGQGPFVIASGDFNGDGMLDAALGTNVGNVVVLLGKQGGGFGPPVTYGANLNVRWLVSADLNNDGRIDLAAGGTTGINVFAGNGDGSFLPPVNLMVAHTNSIVQVADLNGDAKPDLISIGTSGPWLGVLINQAK